ncbi:isoflavone reductase [Citrus sinensis]|uniref:Isoflavone reductase n=1 Tax=Citrus sinensis TaxID=2711 RepID=A0ACB8M5Q2_CITSI|nr:isoflavone reductase [Citrus sinensis]
MVKASVFSGHKAYAYARPLEIYKEFQDIGVAIIEGELDEHEKKIVSIFKEVDVVISTVAYPQFRDQLKIDDAIKVAGNIKLKFPITFVSAHLYGAYFVNVLLRQSESQDEVFYSPRLNSTYYKMQFRPKLIAFNNKSSLPRVLAKE